MIEARTINVGSGALFAEKSRDACVLRLLPSPFSSSCLRPATGSRASATDNLEFVR